MRLPSLRPVPAVRLLALLASFGTASCGSAGYFPPGGEACAWRLVEVEGVGGKRLVLEPDGPGGASPDGVVVRLSRDRAAVGEVVEAEVRVPQAAGRRWVEVRPGRPGVRILGPGAWIAEGGEPVTARFTCDTSGPGGVLVVVKE